MEERPLPDSLGPLFHAVNPGRLQRCLDDLFGFDTGEFSTRPTGPEIPEALFLDFVRPLAALKYENEINYMVTSITSGLPTIQELDMEYVFRDWSAAELQLIYENEQLRIFSPGYQRTLGVGRRGNWAHAFQVHPFIYLREDFIGGRAVYFFSWKPERESPWSTSLVVGADRVLAGEVVPVAPGLAGAAIGRAGESRRPRDGRGEGAGEGPRGVWRPAIQYDLWYTFRPRLTVGIENDIFPHDTSGEYVVLPHVNWRAGEHFLLQAGAGYYQLGSESGSLFTLRVNLLNPSPRRTHPALEERREAEGGELESTGRRGLARFFGGR